MATGNIEFWLNESGANVTVVYDDGSTNASWDGITTGLNVAAGKQTFPIGAHSGYKIICQKDGTGTPFQISTDQPQTAGATSFTGWNSPRGLDANKNPTNGYLFGRVYIGNSATNIGDGTPANPRRGWGVFMLSPDFSTMLGQGAMTYTNGLTPFNTANGPGKWVGMWAPDANAANTSGPYRIRIAPDNSLFVTDFGTPGGGLYQFGPNFEYTNVVFNPVGENEGIRGLTHGDPQGVYTYGSIATGDLTVWTFDPGLSAGLTNIAPNFSSNRIGNDLSGPNGFDLSTVGAYGPTLAGDYNNLFRYDIGAGDAAHYIVRDAVLKVAGSGYNAFGTNDIIIVSGGTTGGVNNTNCVIQVTATNGTGGVTAFKVVDPGDYSVAPATPNSPTATAGGTGTGASFDLYIVRVLWNQAPQFAACLGLAGFFDSQNGEISLSPDHRFVYATFRRLNNSDGNLQIFDTQKAGIPRVYSSLRDQGGGQLFDAWVSSAQGANGAYAGVMQSPDSRFLAAVCINNEIEYATLTNGIPDESSLQRILNTPATANARGMCWDAGGNILMCSSGTAFLRSWSLGNSSTCITSNDITGNAGGFQLILPPVSVSMAATANASQNYVNSGGTPIAGGLRISLNTSTLASALTVPFTATGTAVNPTHYTLNTNGGVPGLVLAGTAPNFTLTFPAGSAPSGNWKADLLVTPTATPLFTNTLTVIGTLRTSASYLRQPPLSGTVFITNTGPQVLLLTAAQLGTTLYRGTSNDYAQFVITRLGDPNGPGNSAGNVIPKSYTVTNFDYFGTALLGTDFTAPAQKWNPAVSPTDASGFPAGYAGNVVINPGDQGFTNVVGNPVIHMDFDTPPINATIILSMTNKVAAAPGDYTNQVSAENFPYSVISNNVVTLTLLDNRFGPEVVLYRNPLINAADSANWTLTFGATNMSTPTTNNILVVPQYNNNYTFDGSHDFFVKYGFDITTDPYAQYYGTPFPKTPVMIASNWNNVLKMTVNKNDTFSPAGLNAYLGAPGAFTNFQGNYALRFSMFLKCRDDSLNNPFGSIAAREFAAFGVNHQGTNCNWRINAPINNGPLNSGNDRTNQDGVWLCLDASTASQTPADFDWFTPGPTPNAGFNVADRFSQGAVAQRGVFKSKPFHSVNTYSSSPNNVGGQPIDKWVDVSFEISKQTNGTLFINKSSIFGNQPLTNGPVGVGVGYTNGTIMLGYLDPVRDGGANDISHQGLAPDSYDQFVYYSNLRVVELSPYLTVQARAGNSSQTNYIVNQFSSLTFTSSATYASAPLTNKWFKGTGTFTQPNTGVPTALLQSNAVNATTFNDSLTKTFDNATDGTNYMNVYSDLAGSVTSRVVAVEVVLGPTNKTYGAGTTNNLLAVCAGPSAPASFGWSFNASSSNFATATRLVLTAGHYGGPGNLLQTNLFITNIATTDQGWYWFGATNTTITNGVAATPNFTVTPAALLTVATTPTGGTVTPTPQVNLWGSNTTFVVGSITGTNAAAGGMTFRWKKDGSNLSNGAHIAGATSDSLTINAITAGDTASYTVGVSNAGGGLVVGTGVLTEFTPAPGITAISTNGAGQVTMTFGTTNAFDTSTSFEIQSAGVVTGPYTNNASAVFSGSNPFSVVGPMNGETLFYRIHHKD